MKLSAMRRSGVEGEIIRSSREILASSVRVASAASIIFLPLFKLVNVAVLYLNLPQPLLERGFHVPWFPFLHIQAIFSNGFLARQVFKLSASAWCTAMIWIVISLLAHFIYSRRVEEMERPKEIRSEEVRVSRDYPVLVPVANEENARVMGKKLERSLP
jgi:membrane protein implicated in regulation of membrane protease activity